MIQQFKDVMFHFLLHFYQIAFHQISVIKLLLVVTIDLSLNVQVKHFKQSHTNIWCCSTPLFSLEDLKGISSLYPCKRKSFDVCFDVKTISIDWNKTNLFFLSQEYKPTI